MSDEQRRTHVFNAQEHVMQIKSKEGSKDYLPVAWRIVWFREECPHGTIDTEELVYDMDREVEAEVYAWNPEKRRSEKTIKKARGYARYRAVVTDGKGGRATGTKSENAANFPDYGEKAETGSIGRALAALGYGTQFAPEIDEQDRMVDSPLDRQPVAIAGEQKTAATEDAVALSQQPFSSSVVQTQQQQQQHYTQSVAGTPPPPVSAPKATRATITAVPLNTPPSSSSSSSSSQPVVPEAVPVPTITPAQLEQIRSHMHAIGPYELAHLLSKSEYPEQVEEWTRAQASDFNARYLAWCKTDQKQWLQEKRLPGQGEEFKKYVDLFGLEAVTACRDSFSTMKGVKSTNLTRKQADELIERMREALKWYLITEAIDPDHDVMGAFRGVTSVLDLFWIGRDEELIQYQVAMLAKSKNRQPSAEFMQQHGQMYTTIMTSLAQLEKKIA